MEIFVYNIGHNKIWQKGLKWMFVNYNKTSNFENIKFFLLKIDLQNTQTLQLN